MRQLFNKSGMITVFYSAVLTLCTILMSLFFNIGSSDITDRFSDNAVLLEINQNNYSDNALSYSDIADVLAKNKARGAMLINASGKGYALIFLYAVIADVAGMAVGFLLTFIISLIPQITFYLGSIRLSYGLLIAVILTAVNIITAYRQSVKYSGKMINSLRRE